MGVRREFEDRYWAIAYGVGMVAGLAWLMFEIGVVPAEIGVAGAATVVLCGGTVVLLSYREARRHGGSVGGAARRGGRTLWDWIVSFVP